MVKLAQWAQQFSPTVGLEDAAEPSSLLLDISGLAPLFGGEWALVQEVRRALQRLGLTARLALADSLGAAWAVAHYSLSFMGRVREECESPGGSLSQQAGTPTQFSSSSSTGCLLVPPGETAAALVPLPIAALRLPAETLARLAQLGLGRIGQLLKLPRQSLASRFGPAVLARVDQALGHMDEAIVAEHPPAELASVHHFESPVERQEPLVAALARLLPELAESLAARRLGAAQIVCRFAGDRGPPVHLAVGLFQPSAAPRHWLELIELQLERTRFSQPVTAVRVEVTATAPLESPQYELFVTGRDAAQPQAVALLIERLSSRLGRLAVVRPRLVADAQPECACGYWPLADLAMARRQAQPAGREKIETGTSRAPRNRGRDRSSLGASPIFSQPPGERPLWLEAKPIPIRVWAVAPEGPPMQFGCHGRSHRVTGVWGPERIETAWWRGRRVRRDYYRVETSGGERWWLFRRLDDDTWFLHGRFA